LDLEPIKGTIVKYFGRPDKIEDFAKETANVNLEDSIKVQAWINSSNDDSGEDAILYWSESQFALKREERMILRFPFTEVKGAKVSEFSLMQAIS
jgi:hypothetical protein